MEELNALLEMTVQLAQISSEVAMSNGNLPWFSILEASQTQCLAQVGSTAKQGGFADLLGKGHSNDALMLSQTDSQVCESEEAEVMEMIMLAQCSADAEAEAEGNCKEADDLQALIDAQRAKISQMKQKRNKTSQRRLPKTHEEAMKVIRNETVS